MFANKLFVVIGVISLILIGLFIYLFLLDKKTRRLEQKLEEWMRKNNIEP
ncbi:MAG: CcmD family protein [Bacteroidales bacterium]